MGKTKLVVYMEDREYRNRFTSCLLQFYGKNMELHIFEEPNEVKNQDLKEADCIILEGEKDGIINFFQEFSKIDSFWNRKILYLQEKDEQGEELSLEQDFPEVVFVDKYKNINEIVDYIRKIHPSEVRLSSKEAGDSSARLIGIYSLSDCGRQLPFAITLGSMLSEKEKVLLIDLQENSGIREYCGDNWEMGLEELVVMAGESGKTFGDINRCIGHIERMDYIYPARNCESLCQIEAENYQKVLNVLLNRLSYDVVILNLGSRFQGFCQMLASCSKVYLLEGKTSMNQWRKREFLEELDEKGYGKKQSILQSVELPSVIGGVGATCQLLVEQWKWSPFGDIVRSLCQKAVCYG